MILYLCVCVLFWEYLNMYFERLSLSDLKAQKAVLVKIF